jgi:hypothetical protein
MSRFNRLFLAVVAITLLLFCGAPAFADVIVYNQPPTLDGNLYASQNDPTLGTFAALYDNFTIVPTIPYYLTDVHWYGGYFNPQQHGRSGRSILPTQPSRAFMVRSTAQPTTPIMRTTS